MRLSDIVERVSRPAPWSEEEKIPWNDPEFSARMLQEHLSQDHDAASRRFVIMDQQVDWIHNHVLNGEPTRILDLGCGPGLYTSRLAGRGHTCHGIDFSPASIAYAKDVAAREDLACTYVLGDIRTAAYGGSTYGLAMLIFGELNVFKPEDARRILRKAHAALAPGGTLLLEPHTFAAVEATGHRPSSWYSTRSGLFSPQPHIMLSEAFWDAEQAVAIQRHYVIDAGTGGVTRHGESMQAYTEDAYRTLLEDCGFGDVIFYPSLTGEVPDDDYGLMAIVARAV